MFFATEISLFFGCIRLSCLLICLVLVCLPDSKVNIMTRSLQGLVGKFMSIVKLSRSSEIVQKNLSLH